MISLPDLRADDVPARDLSVDDLSAIKRVGDVDDIEISTRQKDGRNFNKKTHLIDIKQDWLRPVSRTVHKVLEQGRELVCRNMQQKLKCFLIFLTSFCELIHVTTRTVTVLGL
jgi:hypothetical protein